MLALTGSATGDPFSPCHSYTIVDSSQIDVQCIGVRLSTVQSVFKKLNIKYDINEFFLIPNTKDQNIPANLIGNQTVRELVLSCPTRRNYSLSVDRLALTSTKEVTATLYIENCDLKTLDWSFLSGFSLLESLYIDYSSNLPNTFYTLPTSSLTRLVMFSLNNVLGIEGFNNNSLKFPKPVPNGIASLWIWFCDNITDTTMDNILTKWVTPTSADSMNSFQLAGADITRIPSDIFKYTQLEDVTIFDCFKLSTIQYRSFNFEKVPTIYLDHNVISSVSPGAFSGIFF